MQNYGPDKAKCKFWVSIYDFIGSNVDKADLEKTQRIYIMPFPGISCGWCHPRQMWRFTQFYVCSLVEIFIVPFMFLGSLLENNCSLSFDKHIDATQRKYQIMHKTKWRIVDFCVVSHYISTWHQKLNIHCWLQNLWKNPFSCTISKILHDTTLKSIIILYASEHKN